MTKHLTLLVIAALSALLLCAGPGVRLANAAAGDIYNLGTLGGTLFSVGYDINDAGQVVGTAQDAVERGRAFLWESSHGMTDLGTADGYTQAWASAINTSGSVVGVELDYETDNSHAFAWTPNQPNSTTGTMTSLARSYYTTAEDINAAGRVVGSNTIIVFDEGCTPDHPYYPNCGTHFETRPILWENGVGSDLFGGSTQGGAHAINNAGQVVGYFLYNNIDLHAFRFDGTPGSGGVMHDLGTLGGSLSVGHAINDAGQVVGQSRMTGDAPVHAFRYTGTPGAGGVMVDLGTLGGISSRAFGINEAGFVVGDAFRAADAGDGSWATLWRNDAGNTAVDLDAWLDAINPTLGAYWGLTEARAINNDGLITGTGYYDDGPGGLTDGSRAFVLDASNLVSAIPGDFNNNGTVDAADYIVWRKTDGTQNGYNTWRANFGTVSPGIGATSGAGATGSANAAVPEPGSLLLMAIAAACFAQRARRLPSRGTPHVYV
jgi:probable HAF family extracellular repeat protein